MPRNHSVRLKCPICKKPVKKADAEFPFCSERCRTIDLGKWASGQYVIASSMQDMSEGIEDAAPEDSPRKPQ